MPDNKSNKTLSNDELLDSIFKAHKNSGLAEGNYSGPVATAFGNTNFGESQYDNPNLPSEYIKSGDYNFIRGQKQSWLDKAGNGIANMAGKAMTTAAEGIVNPFYGLSAGLASMMDDDPNSNFVNSFYNNSFTQLLDSANKKLEEQIPFYETKSEHEATGLSKLWRANTLFRDVFGGIGTSIGAIGTGSIEGKLLTNLAKGLGAVNDVNKFNQVLQEYNSIDNASDKLKFLNDQLIKNKVKNGLENGYIALTGAMGEAGVEARQTEAQIKQTLTSQLTNNGQRELTDGEKEYVDHLSKQGGDAAFGLNLPVIMLDNWLSFGKSIFGNKTNDFAKLGKDLMPDANDVYKVANKTKLDKRLYLAKNLLAGPLSEGTQEQLQYAIGQGLQDYAIKKYYNPSTADFLDSMSKGLAEAYTSEEGIRSGIIGALSAGPISYLAQGSSLYKNPEDQGEQLVVDHLNQMKTSDVFKSALQTLNRQANISEDQDEAIKNNDQFDYQNKQNDVIYNWIYNRLKAGKLDDVKQQIENFKSLDKDQLETTYGIKLNDQGINKLGGLKSYLDDRLSKIDQISNTVNNIEQLFPNAHPEIKELLGYSAFTIANSKNRKSQLHKDITDILHKPENQSGSLVLNTYDYSKLSPEEKINYRKSLQESNVNPIDQELITSKLDDIDKLNLREQEFVNTYKALKDPVRQQQLLDGLSKVEKFVEEPIEEAKETTTKSKTTKPSLLDDTDDEFKVYHTDGIINDQLTKAKTAEQVDDIINNAKQSGDFNNDELDQAATERKTDLGITNNVGKTEIQSLEDHNKKTQDLINALTNHVEQAKQLPEDQSNVVINEAHKLLNSLKDVYDNPATSAHTKNLIDNLKSELEQITGKQVFVDTDLKITDQVSSTVVTTNPNNYNQDNPDNSSDIITPTSEQSLGKSFNTTKPNVVMMSLYKFIQGTKKFLRNNQGEVITNESLVSKDINKPEVASVESTVYYRKVDNTELSQEAVLENSKNILQSRQAITKFPEGYSKADIDFTGDLYTANIGIFQDINGQETCIGFVALPHYIKPLETEDLEQKSKDWSIKNQARQDLLALRQQILTNLESNTRVENKVAIKGKGKLLTKILNGKPVLTSLNSLTRTKDLYDNKHLFVYDNGESLTTVENESQLESKFENDYKQVINDLNSLSGTSFADPETKAGIGKVYKVVKTANGSAYVLPVYTDIINNSPNSKSIINNIIKVLQSNITSDSINYKSLVSGLQDYVFTTSVTNEKYAKTANAIKVDEFNKHLSIGGKTFSLNEILNATDKLKQAIGTLQHNININKINDKVYQNQLLKTDILKTSSYLDESGEFYVQPYIELDNILSVPNIKQEESTTFTTNESTEKPVSNEPSIEDIIRQNAIPEEGDELFSKTKFEGKLDLNKVKKTLDKILPGLTIADIDLAKQIKPNIKDAYGMFKNMVIYLFEEATDKTAYHEAFHGVFRNMLNNSDRTSILNEARNTFAKPNDEQLESLRTSVNQDIEFLEQLYYEEQLADAFADYLDLKVNKSLGQKILDFFKKIFDLFNIFKGKSTNQIEQLFDNISTGKFKQESIKAKYYNKPIDLDKFGEAFSRIPNLKLGTQLDRTKSIADHFINEYVNLLSKGQTTDTINPKEIFESIKDQYKDFVATESAKDKPNKQLITIASNVYMNFNTLAKDAIKLIDTRKIKIKGNIEFTVEDGIKSLTSDIDGTDDISMQQGNTNKEYGQEMTSISGIKSASHVLKLFLSNIPVLQNGKPELDNFGFTKYHSYEKLYYYLEKQLTGTTSFEEQTKILDQLSIYRPEVKQVLDAINNIQSPEMQTVIQRQFSTNFAKQQLEYIQVSYEKVKDKYQFKIYNPNRKDVYIDLKDRWTKVNLQDPSRKEMDSVRSYDIEKSEYYFDKAKVNTLLKTLENTSNLTLDQFYDYATTVGIDMNYDALKLIYNAKSKELFRDLTDYIKGISDPNNYRQAAKGLDSLIRVEFTGNTELFTQSFNNIEKSVVYSIQNQSFASRLIRKLTKSESGSLSLIEDLERDPIYKNNPLLARLKEDRSNLRMYAIDGLKENKESSKGKKFNGIHSDDYFAMAINMFLNKKTDQNIAKASTAIYTPIIPAEKGLAFAYEAPKYPVVLQDNKVQIGQITEQFLNIFYNEASRIQQALKDKQVNDPTKLIEKYHYKKDPKAFDGNAYKFLLTNAITGDLYKDIITLLENNLDTDVQTLFLNNNKLFNTIHNHILAELQNEYEAHLNKAIDSGVVFYKDNLLTSNSIDIQQDINAEVMDKLYRQTIADFALNSYLFNISSSLLINGDPAFYKNESDNGKRFYQGYSMTRHLDTSILSTDEFKYLKGGKMNISVVKDVQSGTNSYNDIIDLSKTTDNPDAIKTILDENYKSDKSIEVTDAQVFVSVKLWQEIQKAYGVDSKVLQEAIDYSEGKGEFKPEFNQVLSIIKPFVYGVQWDTNLNKYTPVQIKCAIFPLTHNYVKDNPILKEHKDKMNDDNYPQAIAFKSSLKALLPGGSNVESTNNLNTFSLDMSNFGIQVDNPNHSLDEENSSMRQLKMLFYGMVEDDKLYGNKTGKELKVELAKLESENLIESLDELVNKFTNDKTKLHTLIQEAVTSRNATSIVEKIFSVNPDGNFQYPLDLTSHTATIQLISSLFTDHVVRQEFEGGSAVQASSLGYQVKSKYANLKEQQENLPEELLKLQTSLKWIQKDPNNPNSIDYIEAAMPYWTSKFLDKDGMLRSDIPDEVRKLIIYRIPTEGAHSMMPIKVTSFLPNEYANVILLPYEVTRQFGADFDFDKIYFISKSFDKDFKVNDDLTTKEGRNNKIFDIYDQILRSTNMLQSLITPSGPGDIATVYEKVRQQANNGNYFTPRHQVALKDIFHKISKLKGSIALQVTGHAWATTGNLELDNESAVNVYSNGNKVTYTKLSNVLSEDKGKIVEELSAMMATILDAAKEPEQLPSIGISGKTLPVWSLLVRLGLGVKVASQFTSQEAIKKLSLALDSNDKQLKGSEYTRKTVDDIKAYYIKAVNTLLESDQELANANKDVPFNQIKTFSLDKLDEFTGISKAEFKKLDNKAKLDYYKLQLQVLNTFDLVTPAIDELQELNSLFSINKEVGPNFEDINNKKSIVDKINTEVAPIVKGKADLINNDIISPYINTFDEAYNVIADHFMFATDFFNSIKDQVADMQLKGKTLVNLKAEDRETINGFVKMFLDANTSFKDIYGHQNLFEEDFVKEVSKLLNPKPNDNYEYKIFGNKKIEPTFKEKIRNTVFFQSIETDLIKGSNIKTIKLKGNRLELAQKEQIIESLLALYNTEVTKDLAKRLVQHSFKTSGFFTQLNGYFNLIDPSILEDMGVVTNRIDIKKQLDDPNGVLNSGELNDRLIDQLIRNFPTLFTKVFDTELFDEVDGNLVVNIESNNPRLKELYNKVQGDIINPLHYIRVYNKTIGASKLYKLDNEIYKNTQSLTYQPISMLGSKGRLIEINPLEDINKSIIATNNYEKVVFNKQNTVDQADISTESDINLTDTNNKELESSEDIDNLVTPDDIKVAGKMVDESDFNISKDDLNNLPSDITPC